MIDICHTRRLRKTEGKRKYRSAAAEALLSEEPNSGTDVTKPLRRAMALARAAEQSLAAPRNLQGLRAQRRTRSTESATRPCLRLPHSIRQSEHVQPREGSEDIRLTADFEGSQRLAPANIMLGATQKRGRSIEIQK